MKFNLLKNWRIIIMFLCVIGSLFAIMPLVGRSGVIVKSVDVESPFADVLEIGETIQWANEQTIETEEDFYQFEDYVGVFRFKHSGKLELVDIKEPGLGVIVSTVSRTNLNFGLDLAGGTRVLLEPEENVTDVVIDQILATLETRINTFGLLETTFQKVEDVSGNKYVQIEMAGGTRADVEDLLARQGVFEGRIPLEIEISNNTGEFSFNGETYTASIEGNALNIDGKTISVNISSSLDDVEFQFINFTEETILLEFIPFRGADITSVCIQEQPGICSSRVTQVENGYQFLFQVFITEEAADRFAKITADIPIVLLPGSDDSYLEEKIKLFLDEKMITELSIASGLKGKAFTQPMITGYAKTMQEAINERLRLQSILQSGSLPVKLKIIRLDQISASLGQEFIRSAGLAGMIAAAAVGLVVFLRYRRIKIAIPVVLISLSEVVIILGAASIIKWTIDLAAIAGIIAAVGTGVDSQIMIIDELLLMKGKTLYTLKQKVKRAFFIIFGSAATTIAAMIPLMFIGVGVMKGFAIVTTLGVLIGIFITRPAFGKIAEFVLGSEKKEPTS